MCRIAGGGLGPSFVDIAISPHIERMAASVLYYKGVNLRNNPRWPALNAW